MANNQPYKSEGAIEDFNDTFDRIDDILNKSFDSQGSKRGRPFIEWKWTKVLLVDNLVLADIKTYAVSSDLLMEGHLPSTY